MGLWFVDENNALLNHTRLLFKYIMRKPPKNKPSWSPGFETDEIPVHLHELGYKIFLELNLKMWFLCQMIWFTFKNLRGTIFKGTEHRSKCVSI